MNAVAGVALALSAPDPPLLLGPGPQGLLGALPWVVLGTFLAASLRSRGRFG